MTAHTDKSPADIAQSLRELADAMADCATDLDYYGGTNAQWREKSMQLVISSAILRNWAHGIDRPLK